MIELFLYFAEAGFLVFGSGLAIIPFLQSNPWLTTREFIDAVAISLITPGPVVITVAFMGYLVAGLAGASVAALGVFVPVWLVTIVAAPYYKRFAVRGFVDGVTAAATGAIAGAAVIIGVRALPDIPAVLICAAVLVAPKKLPEATLILAAGLGGALLR